MDTFNTEIVVLSSFPAGQGLSETNFALRFQVMLQL